VTFDQLDEHERTCENLKSQESILKLLKEEQQENGVGLSLIREHQQNIS
jgi:hypothetical protein